MISAPVASGVLLVFFRLVNQRNDLVPGGEGAFDDETAGLAGGSSDKNLHASLDAAAGLVRSRYFSLVGGAIPFKRR